MGPEKVRSVQAATLIAVVGNAYRDPKKCRAYRVEDFHPYPTERRRKGMPLDAGAVHMLRTMVKEGRL